MTGGAALLAVALTTACSPDPTPTPTPTGFASEEEAFAAAEATYRAYSEALNAKQTDTPSERDPDSYLTGSALEGSLAGKKVLTDAGVRIIGTSEITRIDRVTADSSTAILHVCIDNTAARVIDTAGTDVTPAERDPVGALEIEVIYSDPEPLVLRSELLEDVDCS